jgi:hypothetical protein
MSLALLGAVSVSAAEARIIKVLPFYLDHKGRNSVSPSLYDRDAYQAYLRDNPELQSGMRYAVQWKAKGKPARPFLLRLEMRGIVQGSLPRTIVIERLVRPGSWFTNWDDLLLVDEDYARFGKVTAWRATLWERGKFEDDTLLSEQKSFLW